MLALLGTLAAFVPIQQSRLATRPTYIACRRNTACTPTSSATYTVMEPPTAAQLVVAPPATVVDGAAPPPAVVKKSPPRTAASMRLLDFITLIFQWFPPATAVLCVIGLAGRLPFQASTALSSWFCLEAAHHVGSKLAARMPNPKAPSMEPDERLKFWRACLNDPTQSVEDFITGWFIAKGGKTPVLSDLRRENAVDFVAWALFGAKNAAKLPVEEQTELQAAMEMLEARLSAHMHKAMLAAGVRGERPSFRFPAGRTRGIRAMRVNLDSPARHFRSRPLLYYLLTDVLACGVITPMLMRSKGFRLKRTGPLSYWVHEGLSKPRALSNATDAGAHTTAQTPLVFVHGVGLGPLPYIGFIDELLEQAEAPLMVLELPFVAQRLTAGRPPSQEACVDAIARAMEEQGMRAATFVGHSLGSVYLSWVAQLRPQLIASAVFIDPIVFLLHHQKVAHKFLYDKPHTTRASVESYFVKSERRIVSYFHRHFYFHQNLLWAEDCAFPTSVVLSTEDSIVPVPAVEAYLRAHPRLSLEVLDGASHGAFLTDDGWKNTVLGVVANSRRSGWLRAGVEPPMLRDIRRGLKARTRGFHMPHWVRLPELPPPVEGLVGAVDDTISEVLEEASSMRKAVGLQLQEQWRRLELQEQWRRLESTPALEAVEARFQLGGSRADI